MLFIFSFHPARTQDGVLFFLPENVVKNAHYDRFKLLPSLIRCLLIHRKYLPSFLPFALNYTIGVIYVTAKGLPIAEKIRMFDSSFNNSGLD
jgi:hypothetical protein